MTDTELLDGLQGLFDSNVVVLRSCRSGVKLELCRGDFIFDDSPAHIPREYREYFGSGAALTDGTPVPELGPDIRTAIRRALLTEPPVVRKPITPNDP